MYDISSLSVNQLLYCVYLKIYSKFANYFCELKFSGNTKNPSSAWGCDTSGNIPPCGVVLRRTCRCTEFHRERKSASPARSVLRKWDRRIRTGWLNRGRGIVVLGVLENKAMNFLVWYNAVNFYAGLGTYCYSLEEWPCSIVLVISRKTGEYILCQQF